MSKQDPKVNLAASDPYSVEQRHELFSMLGRLHNWVNDTGHALRPLADRKKCLVADDFNAAIGKLARATAKLIKESQKSVQDPIPASVSDKLKKAVRQCEDINEATKRNRQP